MSQNINKIVNKKLREIESEHNVKILLAVESGSRAWGFESKDSDYDVRFIYKHTPDWYLSILPGHDTIEYPIVDLFDYAGWDLKKSLFLMNKSNPVLFEWLKSPIVYLKDESAYQVLLKSSEKYFSQISSIYHYLNMAKTNYHNHLQDKMVKVKKYFYVLRPLFSCLWIEQNQQSPPIEFEIVMNQIGLDKQLLSEVTQLLYRKRQNLEMGLEEHNSVLDDFIRTQINYFENYTKSISSSSHPNIEYLNEQFINLLD